MLPICRERHMRTPRYGPPHADNWKPRSLSTITARLLLPRRERIRVSDSLRDNRRQSHHKSRIKLQEDERSWLQRRRRARRRGPN
jgi:hypothetical protein